MTLCTTGLDLQIQGLGDLREEARTRVRVHLVGHWGKGVGLEEQGLAGQKATEFLSQLAMGVITSFHHQVSNLNPYDSYIGGVGVGTGPGKQQTHGEAGIPYLAN